MPFLSRAFLSRFSFMARCALWGCLTWPMAMSCQGDLDQQQMQDPGAPGTSGRAPTTQGPTTQGPTGSAGDMEFSGRDLDEASLVNQSVFERLKPTCGICHGQGSSSWEAFASLESFENLLVYNEEFVVAGDASASQLMDILGGRGEVAAMPPTIYNFEQLDERGETMISVEELRAWINGLTPRVGEPVAAPMPTIRFKSASQIVNALYAQLGLEPGDFFGKVRPYLLEGLSRDLYPVVAGDEAKVTGKGSTQATSRWGALGGGSLVNETTWSNLSTTDRALALTHISQAWCRLGVRKNREQAVLRFASLADSSAGAPEKIKQNIAYLHLRLLGKVASAERVGELFELFEHYEPAQGETETAWTAVCSALVRHPLWMAY